jgi:PIN domain nuclease of toxin-antitoxin system
VGVRFLLDTHVLRCLLSAPDRVPAGVRGMLANRDNQLLVSAASGLEIATRIRVGKLAAPVLPATLSARVEGIGATELPMTIAHAVLAGSLAWSHRDPFDRLLVAQATTENATLVTVDEAMTGLAAPVILTR